MNLPEILELVENSIFTLKVFVLQSSVKRRCLLRSILESLITTGLKLVIDLLKQIAALCNFLTPAN